MGPLFSIRQGPCLLARGRETAWRLCINDRERGHAKTGSVVGVMDDRWFSGLMK